MHPSSNITSSLAPGSGQPVMRRSGSASVSQFGCRQSESGIPRAAATRGNDRKKGWLSFSRVCVAWRAKNPESLSCRGEGTESTEPAGRRNRAKLTHHRRWVAAMLAIAVAIAAWAPPARAGISPRDETALAQASLIYIATVRKDGNQSKAAPVWFTPGADNDSILIQTGPGTWKAKRIRRGSPVLIWIGSATGPAFIGKAEITSDTSIRDKILDDFRKKYFANRMLGVGPSQAKFDSGKVIAIKITPVRDFPDGFESAPGTPAPALEAAPSGAPTPAH